MIFWFEIDHPVSVHRMQQDPKINVYNWDVNYSKCSMHILANKEVQL